MSESITILDRRMTCEAAPSQWELRLSDGRRGYVRYRHANLKIGFGATADEAVDTAIDIDLRAPFDDDRECSWADVEPYVLNALENQAA